MSIGLIIATGVAKVNAPTAALVDNHPSAVHGVIPFPTHGGNQNGTQKPWRHAGTRSHHDARGSRLAVAWAAAEGWNPGLHDAACFHDADPEGFLIAEAYGHPVGCISCVTYGDAFAFIGFYIVLPEHRGNGYGMALWKAALERAGTRVVGLDGVVAQQANYRKSGFVLAYNNIRFETIGRVDDRPALVPLAQIPLDELVAYDARFFPVPRRKFLQSWVTMSGSAGFAIHRYGRLAGYGMIRPCAKGFKIGPLFADAPDIAETLYRALSAHAPDAPVYLDVPEVNSEAMALAQRHHMNEVFQTARMYLNGTPITDINGIFGVTTFELG